MQQGVSDPLGDLEDLVGTTLNVLTQPSADPLAGPLGESPAKAASKAQDDAGADEPVSNAGPLSADSFVEQDLTSTGQSQGASWIGTADDLLQGTQQLQGSGTWP